MEASATPPAQPAPPGRELTVGGVIGQALEHYRAHAGVLLGVAVVIFLISGIVQGVLNDTDSWVLALLASIVSLVAWTLYTGFVVSLVADVRDGKRDFTVGELLSSASHAIVPLILNGILLAIGIAIGFVLLIIPGLYLLTIWAVVAPAIVAERRGPIEAFGRSYELVKGHGWTVFGAIVVAFLILVAFGILFAAIGGAIAGLVGAIVLGVIANVLAAPFAALVASVLFFDLGGGAQHATGPAVPAAPAG